MNVLVIGGSGFLGSHIADALSADNHSVTIFDVKSSAWASNSQTVVVADISDQPLLEREIRKADVVYHMAGIADIAEAKTDPLQTISDNIMGSAKVISLCAKHSVRLMYGSTIYVYSKHGSFYRASKQAVETLIEVFHEESGLQYTILRFGSLYGERSDNTNGLTNIINRAIVNGEISYVGSKAFVREYIHVLDAAKASADVLKDKYKNQHIILTGKKKIKVHDFLKILAKICKVSKKIKFLNKKYIGHYTLSPFTYKPKIGKRFALSSQIDFSKGLQKLINGIKKNKKIQ